MIDFKPFLLNSILSGANFFLPLQVNCFRDEIFSGMLPFPPVGPVRGCPWGVARHVRFEAYRAPLERHGRLFTDGLIVK